MTMATGPTPTIRVLVATVAHRGNDARILHRQIGALLEAGCQVIYVAPVPLAEQAGLEHIVVPRATGRCRVAAWFAAARAVRAHRDEVDLMLVHDLELVLPARVAAWPRRVVWDVHEDLVQSVADRNWIPRTFRPAARALVALTERVATFGIRLLLAEMSYADRFGSWPVVPNTTRVPNSLAPYSDVSRPRLVYVGRISWSRG
ncbi:MAG: glycosyl transferase, partial [Acidimicrobiales bacterium]